MRSRSAEAKSSIALRGQEHRGVALPPRLQRLLHVRSQRRVLNQAPRLVHHAHLQVPGLGRVVHASVDAMQHVEQQRLEQRRELAHRLEVEDLQTVHRQRVARVVEHRAVAPTLDPLVQPGTKRARQQVRQREQPALGAIEDEQVLDRLVCLPVLGIAQAVAVLAFEQHARERVEEVQLFGGRLADVERVDRDALLAEAELKVPALEQPGELAVAVTKIEDDGERVVLLQVRDRGR